VLTYLNHHRGSRRIGLAMVALTTMLLSFPTAVWGGGRHGPHPIRVDNCVAHVAHGRIYRRAVHFRHGRVHVGHHLSRSRRDHTRVRIGVFPRFFHSVRHYRPARRGYVVVRPPVGAIVAALPLGFLTLTLGSSLYYYHGDVYYRPVASGYMVVDPPRGVVVRETPAATVSGGRVVVTAPRLNVRSGPGRGYAVINVVDQGAPLEVAGNASGWLYVNLGDGRHGWVQQTYTAALMPSASG